MMRHHKIHKILVATFVCFLLDPFSIRDEVKLITSEATYSMGDGESPSFAETMVLQKAKQMALEQAGAYVESYTRIRNYDLTEEEIQTIAGGVLQVEVLGKPRTLIGDSLRFYTKIKAIVTTDKMEELVLCPVIALKNRFGLSPLTPPSPPQGERVKVRGTLSEF